MAIRTSGLLIHPTSLFNRFGIGDLGPEAYRFVDMLAESGQNIWQMLPMNPTEPLHAHSPYHSTSAFAGNPLLISPELLASDGWLGNDKIGKLPESPEGYVDFESVKTYKDALFDEVFFRFEKRGEKFAGFERFCGETDWLENFAVFTVLRRHYPEQSWSDWPGPYRDRDPDALAEVRKNPAMQVQKEKLIQYLFFNQWRRLKKYCSRKGVRIFGDIPIYMPYDSADVWAHPEQYKLDENLRPRAVSGVPPDYFSSTGQLWGHPVYDWSVQRQNRYSWWIRRIAHNLELFDIVRIDHFRGLVGFWEVAPEEQTAEHGRWEEAPAKDFLESIFQRFGRPPIVAEDLGTITPDVIEIMRLFDLPGMRVLQFGFGDDFPDSTHLPHLHEKNCVVYTGSHDNNTLVGWYRDEIDEPARKNVQQYFGRPLSENEIHWEMIRMAMMSPAETAIIPVQDIAGLGSEARMNTPGQSTDSWRWRMKRNELTPEMLDKMRMMTRTYGRLVKAG